MNPPYFKYKENLKSKMVPYTMKMVLPLLTCYVIVEGFYVMKEKSDVQKLTDLLLGYMSNDAFLSKINARKLPNILDDALNNDLNFENIGAENYINYNQLSNYKTKSSDRSGLHKRARTSTAMFMSRRDPCNGVLIGGPFLKSLCGWKRNFTG